MKANTVKILIVEDSPVVMLLLKHLFDSDPACEVIGTARDGREAILFVGKQKPDVILMDVHMPGMDGYEATRQIMETQPVPIVISSASMKSSELNETFDALEAGAVAFVEKPPGIGSPDFEERVGTLLQTIKLMAEIKVVKRWPRNRNTNHSSSPVNPVPMPKWSGIQLIAMGASTGGPPVINKILKGLPAQFPFPILIVQHIAPGFLKGMVDWLNQSTPLSVHMAAQGTAVKPGHVYLAPENVNMGITPEGRIFLCRENDINNSCPSVSFLFKTLADTYGAHAVGILLSGMGRDGADELKLLRDKGAMTMAQDEETSVVHGMPGEAIKLDAAAYILPPEGITAMLVKLAENK